MTKGASGRILCQLKSDTGEELGAPIDLPLNVDKADLEKICQALLASEKADAFDEDVPYAFFVDSEEFYGTLQETLDSAAVGKKEKSVEKVTEIIYQPQALFKYVQIGLGKKISENVVWNVGTLKNRSELPLRVRWAELINKCF